MKFNFGSIVIVDYNLVGVVVKCWEDVKKKSFNYDVYVRSYNGVKNYPEEEIKHIVYDKELSEESMEILAAQS